MGNITGKVKQFISLVKSDHLSVVIGKIKGWFWSDRVFIGLIRDITQPFETPVAKIPLVIRVAEEEDIEKIKEDSDPEVLSRIRWLGENIGILYVALSPDNTPCYMQWLFGSDENDRLQTLFRGTFPILDPDTVLIEGAYTFGDFRGLSIMPCAMSQITEKADELEASKVITFVEDHNIPALKGCKRAGYAPHLIRKTQWRLFRKKITFEPLSPGTHDGINWIYKE